MAEKKKTKRKLRLKLRVCGENLSFLLSESVILNCISKCDIISKKSAAMSSLQDLDEDDEALSQLTGSSSLRAKLKQLILDQRSRIEFREVSTLAELEERVDELVVVADEALGNEEEEKEEGSELEEQFTDEDLVEDEDRKVGAEKQAGKATNQKSKIGGGEVELPVRISRSMGQISGTFASIFQTLLVLIESGTLDGCKILSPEEEDRVTRRCKDFEVRFGRMTFELKQKFLSAQGSLSRLNSKPNDPSLQREADSRLLRTLRVSISLLRAYQQHLPLASGRVYPRPALEKALEVLASVSILVATLGYEPNSAREFAADVGRLRAAAERHWSEREKPTVAQKKEGRKSDPGSNRKNTIDLINNLAREKFGAAAAASTSPKKTNIKRQQQQQQKAFINAKQIRRTKQQVILPKGNKLLEERARQSRARRFGEEGERNITQKRGTLTAFADDHFANTAERQEEESKIESDGCGGPLFMELDREELDFVLRHRRRETKKHHGQERALFLQLSSKRPLWASSASDPSVVPCLVGLLADKVVDEAVRDVCSEMSSRDVIEKIFRSEFM